MKMKNILMMVVFGLIGQSLVATEIDIVNNTGEVMTITPMISLAGGQTLGKSFTHVPNESFVSYSSGIYSIKGFDVILERNSPSGKYRIYTQGQIIFQPNQVLAVGNLKAAIVVDKGNVAFIYPDKNNKKVFFPVVLTVTKTISKETEDFTFIN